MHDVGFGAAEHLLHLAGRALQDRNYDLWKARPEPCDRIGQQIASVRMSGGDDQFPLIVIHIVRAEAFQGFDLAKNPLGCRTDQFALVGDSTQPLAVARKDLDAQFVFEFNDRH